MRGQVGRGGIGNTYVLVGTYNIENVGASGRVRSDYVW